MHPCPHRTAVSNNLAYLLSDVGLRVMLDDIYLFLGA